MTKQALCRASLYKVDPVIQLLCHYSFNKIDAVINNLKVKGHHHDDS